MVDRKREAKKRIARMQDEREKLILELRYQNRESWEKIMATMYIERSHSFRIHHDALLHFYDIMHEEES